MKKLAALFVFFIATSSFAAVNLEIGPDSPVIISSDFTYTDDKGNEVQIQGPWTLLKIKITNNMNVPIDISGLSLNLLQVAATPVATERGTIVAPGDTVEHNWYVGALPPYNDDYVLQLEVKGTIGLNPNEVTLASSFFSLQK